MRNDIPEPVRLVYRRIKDPPRPRVQNLVDPREIQFVSGDCKVHEEFRYVVRAQGFSFRRRYEVTVSRIKTLVHCSYSFFIL